jgi:hypothetical protein
MREVPFLQWYWFVVAYASGSVVDLMHTPLEEPDQPRYGPAPAHALLACLVFYR